MPRPKSTEPRVHMRWVHFYRQSGSNSVRASPYRTEEEARARVKVLGKYSVGIAIAGLIENEPHTPGMGAADIFHMRAALFRAAERLEACAEISMVAGDHATATEHQNLADVCRAAARGENYV